MKAVLVLVLAAGVASADPPGATRADPSGATRGDPPAVTRVDPPPGARAQAITATVASAIFLSAAVFSAVRADQASTDAAALFAKNAPATVQLAAIDRADHWHDATYALAGITVVSAVVTGVLWSRAQPHYRVSLTAGGASVGYVARF